MRSFPDRCPGSLRSEPISYRAETRRARPQGRVPFFFFFFFPTCIYQPSRNLNAGPAWRAALHRFRTCRTFLIRWAQTRSQNIEIAFAPLTVPGNEEFPGYSTCNRQFSASAVKCRFRVSKRGPIAVLWPEYRFFDGFLQGDPCSSCLFFFSGGYADKVGGLVRAQVFLSPARGAVRGVSLSPWRAQCWPGFYRAFFNLIMAR